MADYQQIYFEKLRRSGYSNTRPRRLVFEVFLQNGHHPLTMQELLEKAEGSSDRASVYRSVLVLQQIGVLKRLQIGWKHKYELSDDFQGHHHHLSCIQCGASQAAPDNIRLEALLAKMAQQQGYSITDHQLEISGICRECQN